MLKMTDSPPMGWNSWNGYMGSPDEAELKATMRYMAAHLLPFGYEYCVTDAGWYNWKAGPNTPTAEHPIPHYSCDRHGRPLPHPEKYPSGHGSFLPISRYAHSLGLKFGLHMMRGMNRRLLGHGFTVCGTDVPLEELIDPDSPCAWAPDSFGIRVDHPAAQRWYDALFANFAAWEIDFVKYDDIASPIHKPEIEMIHTAIDRCGRDILLSLSPGDTTQLEDAAFYSRHADMWRISKDFWDDWASNLRESFESICYSSYFCELASYFTMEGQEEKDILNLLYLMIDKGRQAYFSQVLEYYISCCKEYYHIGVVHITAPMPLSGVQQQRIEADIIRDTKYKKLEVQYTIDPSIYGGLVIRIGDRVLDTSVKSKLARLTGELHKIRIDSKEEDSQ